MMIIKGGAFNGAEYSCMFDPCDPFDACDADNDLIGIRGIKHRPDSAEPEEEAMLWFEESPSMKFVKATPMPLLESDKENKLCTM